ncbi:uncharacterized protein B0I36DRAFT_126571 [Microdochium trichocladiopsis]|uniref:MARVEL domain-containing protein n=1 Tax=Microdochium trichocladiopsis TaxID=1682393 RepID=A0A9P8Y4E1_9PEZI|nr:uncharacterized protein B0I36DRAFT_126571 [Microdochium trichocladiopsis]KAH7028845.1 hypothetical protein B0I36DRAFT_126571 [Microdochium trichocladiopsis]
MVALSAVTRTTGTTSTTDTSYITTTERRLARVHRYHWPAIQLNVWMLIMLAASLCIIGIFGTFITQQKQLLLPIPWVFPYFITTGALTVVFIALLLYLIAQRRLLPSIVIIGAFALFVLWLTGLVVVSTELWGGVNGSGSVAGNCDVLVFNAAPVGVSQETLAWLAQKSICQSWQAVFAFALIGCVFLVWILVIAIQVFYDDDA